MDNNIYVAVLLFLVACGTTGNVVLEDAQPDINASQLFVDSFKVQHEREEFNEKLRLTGKSFNKRSLYEEYIDVIGANGILDGIENVYDKCHIEAHDLGKIIFARLKDIAASLRACTDKCYTGCMHGVLMEVFKEAKGDEEGGHVNIEKLKPLLHDICFKNEEMQSSYGAGECAHATGHALMFLSGYVIPEALGLCKSFDDQKMEYYCADGAYMEYLIASEAGESESLFYPCDTFDYPATCMRTKVGLIGKRLDKVGLDLVKECEKLEGKFRLGCFHGIGTAHAKILALGKMSIKELCSKGSPEEQIACIEGAAEFMGKYFSDDVQETCDELNDAQKEICLAAGKHKLYSLEKDLRLYLNA